MDEWVHVYMWMCVCVRLCMSLCVFLCTCDTWLVSVGSYVDHTYGFVEYSTQSDAVTQDLTSSLQSGSFVGKVGRRRKWEREKVKRLNRECDKNCTSTVERSETLESKIWLLRSELTGWSKDRSELTGWRKD